MTLASGCGPEPRAQRTLGSATSPAADLPPPAVRAEGRVEQVTTKSEAPLDGHRVELTPGDYLLVHDDTIVAVEARRGVIVAFGARGGLNVAHSIQPVLFEDFDAAPSDGVRIEALSAPILHVVRRAQTQPLEHHSWLYLAGDVLTIETQARHLGGKSALVTAGEVMGWTNTPGWVEGHGFVEDGGSYGGAYIARESLGHALAACSHDGRLMARFGSIDTAGYFTTPRTGELRVVVPPLGTTPRRRVSLRAARGMVGDAALGLPCIDWRSRVPLPSDRGAATFIEIAHCEEEEAARARRELEAATPPPDQRDRPPPTWARAGAPHARFALSPERRDVPLPERGCLRARLAAPGFAPGAWFDPREAGPLGRDHPERAPQAGRLRWKVRDERGARLAAKIVVRGDKPQAPDDDEAPGKGTMDPDWGEGPDDGAARNFLYTIDDGERALPPGRYRVEVNHGPEYSAHEATVTVVRDATTSIDVRLERVLDTRGWISADLHLHASPSPDAPTSLVDRLRSLAAVGVEAAVATDHNAVTDYRTALEESKLSGHIATLVGNEVTTSEPHLGHFNLFPLAPDAAPVSWRDADPGSLFARAREQVGSGVIQVNHPRMGDIGYFELLHLDRGDVPGWQARAPLAELGFDAIEVFNGDDYDDIDDVREVLDDWFALLENGLRFTATGNSDSHKIAYQEAGLPRNWVALGDDDPASFDEAAFVRALRAGRVQVSSGPFIVLEAGGRGIGETVAPGIQPIRLEVHAAPWVDVSRVELLRRGHVVRRWTIKGRAKPRLVQRFELELARGDWLVAIVRGAASLPHLIREKGKPFAFTNPIFVE
jgi:hypothetical protein